MFSKIDLIEYSNWVADWCEKNKYRKTVDGAKPYGLGETKTDSQLFDMWTSTKIDTPVVKHISRVGEYGC